MVSHLIVPDGPGNYYPGFCPWREESDLPALAGLAPQLKKSLAQDPDKKNLLAHLKNGTK